jgi:hypothetical protein
MAGYSKLYCIGEVGGYQGSDGINTIHFQILVGEGGRQWLEPQYFKPRTKPMGKIRVIIPEGPDHPNSLLDACIAFYPKYFSRCTLLAEVNLKVHNLERLDFDLGLYEIPVEWYGLREEALPMFKSLNIFEANLCELDLDGYGTDMVTSLAHLAHR